MTTKRQVKKLLTPLVERHDDLAQIGHWLMIKPVRHVLKGIVIAPTSSADWFEPTWAVAYSCENHEYYPLNWGKRLHAGGRAHWRWSDRRMPEVLYRMIEQDVLPMLRTVDTLEEMVAFLRGREKTDTHLTVDWDPLRYLPLQVARGKLDSAREVLDKRLLSGRNLWNEPDMADEFSAVVDPLKPLLLADDRKGLAEVLHGWEKMRIAKLEMEPIWEPTPFPLEEAV